MVFKKKDEKAEQNEKKPVSPNKKNSNVKKSNVGVNIGIGIITALITYLVVDVTMGALLVRKMASKMNLKEMLNAHNNNNILTIQNPHGE
ncbi:hypothetical protein YYC_01822 [Plasmodium yoelii 17X]|uniref:Uncharacterized protein n=2 Tax=Plasmodium yoelii TaxID=5861 RepID=A0AAE9WZH6_PLAYO|nr:hypothetical protein YYC_01822 [Plasmodium yoelii 17X]WBY61325.1 hypothetical protein Py17XNL_001401496 [Plasmodium yoelii yoelii]